MKEMSYNEQDCSILNTLSRIAGDISYDMLNDKSYGLIDDLTIQYNGNQRKSVNDAVSERLNYSGASDFVNGADSTIEYAYDGNGNLLRDRNKGLNFSYDLLGHPLRVWSDDGMNVIEYVYAPDGRKLRTRHSRNRIATVKDFRGALEVVNGDVDRINFQGGFYSYDYVDNHYSRNYYIQDYQGNIRKTERMDDWGSYVSEYTVSVTDYYPYGNPHKGGSDYKYSGKYLDRSYGLDLYDFEARMYDAIVPGFTSPDPLAEDYAWLTPYNYCAGDPVNCVDPTGCSTQVIYDTINNVYNVVEGNLDNDLSIYLCYYDEEGELINTHASIGQSVTQTSFYNSDDGKWEGMIDPNDNSGIEFLDDFYNNTPGLLEYMQNAGNSSRKHYQRYDFKVTNGNSEDRGKSEYNRGMRIKSGRYASARDIGNICAGAIVRKYGMPWWLARFGFDAYQSRAFFKYYPPTNAHSCGGVCFTKWSPEGLQSQNAQRYGYNNYKLFVK